MDDGARPARRAALARRRRRKGVQYTLIAFIDEEQEVEEEEDEEEDLRSFTPRLHTWQVRGADGPHDHVRRDAVLSWTPRVSSIATSLSCSAGVADCHTPLFLSGRPAPFATCALDGPSPPARQRRPPAAAALVAADGVLHQRQRRRQLVGEYRRIGRASLRYAVLIGGFGEWLGATALGYGVSGTIQKGVADTDAPECWACGYCDSKMSVYNVGMLGALIGAACFLLLATFGKMPVSTTHAIVGGVVGMTLVGTSADCLNWAWSGGLSAIIASWVISPLLSGVIGVALYKAVQCVALRGADPVRRSLALLPYLYALNTFVMGWLILLKSKPTEHLPPPIMLGIAVVLAVVAAAAVRFAVVPRVRGPSTRAARPRGGGGELSSSAVGSGAAAVGRSILRLQHHGRLGVAQWVAPPPPRRRRCARHRGGHRRRGLRRPARRTPSAIRSSSSLSSRALRTAPTTRRTRRRPSPPCGRRTRTGCTRARRSRRRGGSCRPPARLSPSAST